MVDSQRSPLGVALITDSRDAKLVASKLNPGALLRCAATYRPISQTCRASECALHPSNATPGKAVCYVVRGQTAFTNRRLETLASHAGATALSVTLAEAELIRGFARQQPRKSGLDLRLGVSGEVSGPKGARALAKAAEVWRSRVGGKVWGYTHAWKRVLRASFGPASVLASVDDPQDIPRAIRRGYVPAIVVHSHPVNTPITVQGVRFIRCPNETVGMACVECRLCLNDARLRERNMGIAFASTKRKLPLL